MKFVEYSGAEQNKANQDKTRRDKTRQGKASQGKAWQGFLLFAKGQTVTEEAWNKEISTMYVAENVLVSYASLTEGTTALHGYSGVLVAEHWVLAHGSMLAPVLSRSRDFLRFFTVLNSGDLTMAQASEQLFDDLTFQIHRNHSLKESGKLVAVWKCPLLEETLEMSLKNFTFEEQHDFGRLLLPVFLMIKCKSLESSDETIGREKDSTFVESKQLGGESEVTDEAKVKQVLLQLAKQATVGKITKGAIVELVSTPFGNAFFIDSVSRGIIGNLLGTNQCLIVIDATSFPGCEGSPVFLINDCGRRNICGMVIASLSRYRGEWVNCTFAVNLLSLLKRILQSRISKDDSRCKILPFTWRGLPEIDTLEKSIAIVKCGPNWGTATLVDEQSGTFITCAHVVTMAPERRIKLATCIMSRTDKFEWFAEANLIYKTPTERPYDIAVLKIDVKFKEPSMKAIELADTDAQKGEEILSIGFPISLKGRATISSGIISKTWRHMFQTDCCVHGGVSGGPIVRRANFKMLGIVVCSVALSNDSVLYPRLCMAIPTTVFKKPLDDYLRTADPKALEGLTQYDKRVASTWNFAPFLTSNM
ncbi:peroxisomal leader peptide-processing protease isoform X2 [Bombus pascuorum]|uniref:peroxisomal leader peptide-processing protease isoform X2 n=1 Tax=Bombus pascuorum TaxID=65598 RepID=UPI00214286A1|nr:peroxisomal leader peptide-processing protease isoform X2 [Bombus pascuorum]